MGKTERKLKRDKKREAKSGKGAQEVQKLEDIKELPEIKPREEASSVLAQTHSQKAEQLQEIAEVQEALNIIEEEPEDQKNSEEENEIQQGDEEGSNFRELYFSQEMFENMNLSEALKKALKAQKYERATQIQSRAIPHAMKGRDVLGASKTGTGKTLAFLIPAVELLLRSKIRRDNGSAVIIITPTRELAMQIGDVAKKIFQIKELQNKTHAVIIGGVKKSDEAHQLKRGVNLVISTPGRLLDHLQNTERFNYHNLKMLIIDEADAILRIGFEQQITKILKLLPEERQTLLFSATQTKKVEDLIKLSLKSPVYIDARSTTVATVEGLEQGYIVVPADKKFLLLFTFLKKNKNKKIMVFMSSCNAVKFYSDLLNYVDMPVKDIHGKQKQQKRTSTYFDFCKQDTGVLLCTDVAQRGLDFPNVDWIVQYDPPDDPEDYIHRVGRTARGDKKGGRALLLLLESEQGFLDFLKKANVSLNEFEYAEHKLAKITSQYQKLIKKNYFLNQGAKDAYRSYLHAYASHKMKDVYDVNDLDLLKIAKAFGLEFPPQVSLNIKVSGSKQRRNKFERLLGHRKKGGNYREGHDSKPQFKKKNFVRF